MRGYVTLRQSLGPEGWRFESARPDSPDPCIRWEGVVLERDRNPVRAGDQSLRRSLVAAAAAAFIAVTLQGQIPSTEEQIPILKGSVRDTKAEAQLEVAGAAGARYLRVYRIDASMELVVRWYLSRLGRSPGAVLDTASLEPGKTTPISYRLNQHSFVDECVDEAGRAVVPDSGAACQIWRRGRDKRATLAGYRSQHEGGGWIEQALFNWVSRELNGDWVHWQVEIRDVGLSTDWKRHQPKVRLTVETVVRRQEQ